MKKEAKENDRLIDKYISGNLESMDGDVRNYSLGGYAGGEFRKQLRLMLNEARNGKPDSDTGGGLHLAFVSGSINNMLDTIHDNLMDKGFDCFNADESAKEVDEYKLTFKDVREELAKYYR